jgi:hypothetical protein
MSIEVIWRALGLIAKSLFFVALLTLTAVSVNRSFTIVVKSLLISSDLTNIFWASALIAAAIPFCFLSVYSFILLRIYAHRVWRFIFRGA